MSIAVTRLVASIWLVSLEIAFIRLADFPPYFPTWAVVLTQAGPVVWVIAKIWKVP